MSTPIGPYTPIVRAGPWLICSGQLGLDPSQDGPVLVPGGAVAEVTQALANAERLLTGEGASVADIVKTTVFLTDMEDYAAVNAAYTGFFAASGDHRPARSAVAVAGLPMGAAAEVEVWAYTAG